MMATADVSGFASLWSGPLLKAEPFHLCHEGGAGRYLNWLSGGTLTLKPPDRRWCPPALGSGSRCVAQPSTRPYLNAATGQGRHHCDLAWDRTRVSLISLFVDLARIWSATASKGTRSDSFPAVRTRFSGLTQQVLSFPRDWTAPSSSGAIWQPFYIRTTQVAFTHRLT